VGILVEFFSHKFVDKTQHQVQYSPKQKDEADISIKYSLLYLFEKELMQLGAPSGFSGCFQES